MTLDVKQYLSELAQKSGLDDTAKETLLKVAENGDFSKSLAEDVMMRSDYSKSMDDARKAREEWEKERAKITDWYGKAYQEWEEAVKFKEKYENGQRVDPSNPNDPNPNPSPSGVTKRELEEALNKQAEAFVQLNEDVAFAITDYQAKFGKPLPVSEIKAAALKEGRTFRDVYRDHVNPLLEEQKTKEWEKKVADALEEGRKAALSEHHIPADVKPAEPGILFRDVPKDQAPSDHARKTNFNEAWVKAQSAT